MRNDNPFPISVVEAIATLNDVEQMEYWDEVWDYLKIIDSDFAPFLPVLINATLNKNNEHTCRWFALVAIKQIDRLLTTTLEVMVTLVEDEEPTIQSEAVIALRDVDGERIYPYLPRIKKVLKNPHGFIGVKKDIVVSIVRIFGFSRAMHILTR